MWQCSCIISNSHGIFSHTLVFWIRNSSRKVNHTLIDVTHTTTDIATATIIAQDEKTAIFVAAEEGHVQIVHFLLKSLLRILPKDGEEKKILLAAEKVIIFETNFYIFEIAYFLMCREGFWYDLYRQYFRFLNMLLFLVTATDYICTWLFYIRIFTIILSIISSWIYLLGFWDRCRKCSHRRSKKDISGERI